MSKFVDLKSRSPWSTLNDHRQVIISPKTSVSVHGTTCVPGSKSFTNRALLLAALASGVSCISGILKSDDSYWCMQVLKDLGVILSLDNDMAIVTGVNGQWPIKKCRLYVGAAGTVARFLPGILAASDGGDWTIEASESMMKRPMKPLLETLQGLGAQISYLEKDGFLPIRLLSTGLQGGTIHLSGSISSQFISGLIIAACFAKDRTTIRIDDHIVQHLYVSITLEMLRDVGAQLRYNKSLTEIIIEPGPLHARELRLEPDVSAACYFMALAALTKGRIYIQGLKRETNQPDIKVLDILERMGCRIEVDANGIAVQGPETLRGGFNISMREMSDQALTIAVLAVFADGPIGINEIGHIRSHESDRIKAICSSLDRAGIKTEERPDGLTVYPGKPKPAVFDSFDDHRVAMSLALMGSVVEGITVNDPGCVSKTFPQFFDELKLLGLAVNYV